MRRTIRSLFTILLPFVDPLSQARLSITRNTDPWAGFVRLDRIGDFILWLPAAKQLTAFYRHQGLKTYLVGNKAWTELARLTNYWDEVIALDPLRAEWDILYRWRSFRRLAKYKTAVLLHPTFSREFLVGDALCHAVRAKDKIAHEGDSRNTIPAKSIQAARWYSKLITRPTRSRPWHELELNAHLCEEMGIQSPGARLVEPPERLPHDLHLPDKFVVISMGSTTRRKIWPERYVYATTMRVRKDYGLVPVIVGVEKERERSRGLAATLDGAVDLTGRLNLGELVYTLKRASLLLAMDSATAHIGAAVNCPTIVVVGGGEPGRFFPYPGELAPRLRVAYASPPCAGCAWSCIHPEFTGQVFPCISNVAPEQVDALVKDLLGSAP